MSRVLDSRGRLFGKVNIVDIVVLLVIVAIVVFAAVRLSGEGAVASVPVKVTFVDSSVDNALVAGMQNKGTIRDAAGNILGELQSVDATPAVQELVTPDGQYRAFSSTTKSRVTFTVICQGTVSDSTVRVGKLAARVGADVHIVGPGYEAQTVIANVVWGPEALK